MFNRSTLLLALAFCLAAPAWTARAEDLSGCWSGCWVSNTTGHKGPLQATLTKIDECHYRADFSGRFFRIIPFRYAVVLNVVTDGEVTELAGQQHVGRRFGTFEYFATVTGSDFCATYSSCKDNGTFMMTRVCSSARTTCE